ncbi:tetratricopeptide repeat protein [Fusobacterium sp. PH5-44]|uniref:tetratricopeptide repeat protein n=1 Tax=Fusobacterium sp. PH5-44 TaxID=2940518 RepID=UPI003D1A0B40
MNIIWQKNIINWLLSVVHSWALNNLGYLYDNQNKYDLAKEYYLISIESALQMAKENSDNLERKILQSK